MTVVRGQVDTDHDDHQRNDYPHPERVMRVVIIVAFLFFGRDLLTTRGSYHQQGWFSIKGNETMMRHWFLLVGIRQVGQREHLLQKLATNRRCCGWFGRIQDFALVQNLAEAKTHKKTWKRKQAGRQIVVREDSCPRNERIVCIF